MRLIDADILIAILQTELNKGVYVKNTLETFIEVLQQCPTAYSVEKVVEELSREFKPILTEKKGFLGISQLVVVGYEINTSKAIEIVRRGGV